MQQSEKRTNIYTLIVIWSLLAVACVIIFQSYILGNETMVFSDVGSDTKDQYLMNYNSIVNHLRAGDFSFWDFSNGLGVNMFIMNLFQPFLVFVYLLGYLFGPEHLSYYLVYVLIAEILLAGTTCYWYLSEFSIKEKYKLPACLMYAFNGYLMIWGQHYQLGSVIVLFPILLLFIEKTFRTKKALAGVAVAAGLLMINGFYQAYMCMLGGGFYVLFRSLIFADGQRREKWKQFFSLAGSMLLGVFLGAVNLFPAVAAQVMTSQRLNTKKNVWEKILEAFKPWDLSYYKTLIFRLFGTNLQGRGNAFHGYFNYYEGIQLFFSTLLILLLVQYVFTIHRQQKKGLLRNGQYILLAFLVLMYFSPLGALTFNGFASAETFARHSFLLMPLFALMSAKVLQQIFEEKKLSIVGLVISAVGMLGVYAIAYKHNAEVDLKLVILLLCMTGCFMAAALFAAAKIKSIDVKLCYLVLVAALFVNVTVDSAADFMGRSTLKKDDAGYYANTYESSTMEALSWIASQDNSFYRVEKDYYTASLNLDSSAQDYMGVSTYNSVRSSGVTEFVKKLWPQMLTGYDQSHLKFTNSLREHTLAALTDVKYILSHSDSLNMEGYELYHQVGECFIYRSTETDSLGKFYTKTITETDYADKKDNIDTWSMLREVLIVDEENSGSYDGTYNASDNELKAYAKESIELLESDKIDQTTCTLTKDGFETDGNEVILPIDTKELAKYHDVALLFRAEISAATEVQVLMDGEKSYVNYQELEYSKTKNYSLEIPQGTKEITIRISNAGVHTKVSKLRFTGTKELSSFSDEAVISISTPQRDGYLTGTVQTETDGIVMLAVPTDEGWTLLVDGKEQEIIEGDYAFIAFTVTAGEHVVTLTYRPPLFYEGALVSLVSLMLVVILWIIPRSRKS